MEKLATIMTDYLLSEKIIGEDEQEVYHYCIEGTLSLFAYWALILSCAIAVGRLWESVIYVLSFMIMRFNVGGYHATTHLRCAILSLITYVIFLILLFYLPINYILPACIIASVLVGVIVLILAPVEHPNKPFSVTERQKYRKGSLLATSGLVLGTAFSLWWGFNTLALCVSFALFQAAISLIVSQKK